jgi:hypothetical protein
VSPSPAVASWPQPSSLLDIRVFAPTLLDLAEDLGKTQSSYARRIYPPSQTPGSFNLEEIHKQIEAAGGAT